MSATVLGIGLDNLISVPCDVNGKMRPEKLTEEIEFAKLNGQIPFCVIATAGTTVRGAFDPIKEISEICTDNNLWLHVDAAWGGSCLFSAKHRHLMDGIELADSLCWDAHKMMGIRWYAPHSWQKIQIHYQKFTTLQTQQIIYSMKRQVT